MLANTPNTHPRRKSPALEAMLSSFETANDLLSGSECSSLASSPVDIEIFSLGPQPSKRQHGRKERSRLGRVSPTPIEIVRDFLDHMSESHAAKGLMADDARVECHSAVVRNEHKDGETAQAAKGDLQILLASCSSCNIEIDGLFACGEDVAAFGHFAYSEGPSSVRRDVHFSIWACVDVAREQIVELRWLNQFVRAEGGSTDRN